jgi:mannose-6-phosphate isomerase-like protein (cupin superfamily)
MVPLLFAGHADSERRTREVVMSSSYTMRNLTEIEDSAPKFGLAETQEARFAKDALGAERTGVSYHRVKPNRRQAFAHRHDQAEEVYVVVKGSGRVKLDDDVLEVRPLDAVRVAPRVIRAFEGGPEGLDLLAVGPRHDGDGELLPGWWSN